jgi:hypothetical protein
MLHPSHFGRDWSSSSLPQLMLPLSQRERGTGIGLVSCLQLVLLHHQHSGLGLCGAPTIAPYCPRQQPVRTCRSPRLGMAAHLRFQGLSLLAPCLAWFQGPRVQFIDLEVVGLLPRHATGRCSLPTCWLFQFNIVGDVPGHACRAGLVCLRCCCSCYPCS